MPKPGEFQAVEIDHDDLVRMDIQPPYYVETQRYSVIQMELIRDFILARPEKTKIFEEKMMEFVSDEDQRDEVYVAKLKARNLLYKCLPLVDGSGLFFCGSTLNRCGGTNSDADICWTVPVHLIDEDTVEYPMRENGKFSTVGLLKAAENRLLRLDPGARNKVIDVQMVDARVKILKFKYLHGRTGTTVDVDLNINNVAGIYNTFLLRHYATIDDRFPTLVKILKKYGVDANIINSKEKRLNSYTITLMVLHFLQSGVYPPILPNLVVMFPEYFSGTMDVHEMKKHYDTDFRINMEPRNQSTLTELLIGFFQYYAHFDYKNKGILLREARVIDKPKGVNAVKFLIEEIYDRLTVPKNLTLKIIKDLQLIFMDAYMNLAMYLDFDHWMSCKPVFYGVPQCIDYENEHPEEV